MRNDEKSQMALECYAAMANMDAIEAYLDYRGSDPFLVGERAFGDEHVVVKYLDAACGLGDVRLTIPGPGMAIDEERETLTLTWTSATESLHHGCIRYTDERIVVPIPDVLAGLISDVRTRVASDDLTDPTNAEALDFYQRQQADAEEAAGTEREVRMKPAQP